jgi:hypothetical protein
MSQPDEANEEAMTAYPFLTEKRHVSILPKAAEEAELSDWRLRDRLKTVSVALVLVNQLYYTIPSV